jgi:hypothetical protein
MGGHFKNVLPYLDEIGFPKEVFVDTGAEYGKSIDVALEYGFNIVVGIEFNSVLCNGIIKKYENNDKVYVFKGSSPEIIPVIVDRIIGQSVVFFHDAHFRGWHGPEEFDPEYGECPLLDELKAVCNISEKNIISCVDDHVMFTEEYWKRDPDVRFYLDKIQWPSVVDINAVMVDKFNFMKVFNGVMIFRNK